MLPVRRSLAFGQFKKVDSKTQRNDFYKGTLQLLLGAGTQGGGYSKTFT